MLEPQDMRKLAKLSRLDLPEDSIPALTASLESLLAHLDELKSLDLSAVEPMTSVDMPATMLRPDVPKPSLDQKLAFGNAPKVEADHFVIPKVIGG